MKKIALCKNIAPLALVAFGIVMFGAQRHANADGFSFNIDAGHTTLSVGIGNGGAGLYIGSAKNVEPAPPIAGPTVVVAPPLAPPQGLRPPRGLAPVPPRAVPPRGHAPIPPRALPPRALPPRDPRAVGPAPCDLPRPGVGAPPRPGRIADVQPARVLPAPRAPQHVAALPRDAMRPEHGGPYRPR